MNFVSKGRMFPIEIIILRLKEYNLYTFFAFNRLHSISDTRLLSEYSDTSEYGKIQLTWMPTRSLFLM